MWFGFPLGAGGKWCPSWSVQFGWTCWCVCLLSALVFFVWLFLHGFEAGAAVGGHRWRSCTAAQWEGGGWWKKASRQGEGINEFWIFLMNFSAQITINHDIKYGMSLKCNTIKKHDFFFPLAQFLWFLSEIKGQKTKTSAAQCFLWSSVEVWRFKECEEKQFIENRMKFHLAALKAKIWALPSSFQAFELSQKSRFLTVEPGSSFTCFFDHDFMFSLCSTTVCCQEALCFKLYILAHVQSL